VISSLFEAYEIPYFLRGGAFSKLYPGMQINHYNTQTFMVQEDTAEFARELVEEFLAQENSVRDTPETSIWQKLRVVIEVVLGGWLVSGKRWKNNQKN